MSSESGSGFGLMSERVLTPEGVRHGVVVVDAGRIAAILAPDEVPSALPVEDLGEKVLMPGLVDSHVHINEPGRTSWEGFETATKAAAAGGVTTLIDMPLNSSPVTTTVAAFHEKLSAADGKLWVDVGFWGGVVPGNTAELPGLIREGVLGFKAFMINSGIDEFGWVGEETLKAALPVVAEAGLVLLAHAELERPLEAVVGDWRRYETYLASRPCAWEDEAIALLIRLAETFNAKVHVVHLSSAQSVAQLEACRARGVDVTVETCPHYLCLSAEEIPDGATEFKCAPPIRARSNQDALWDALVRGVIDCIVTDHSPSEPALKCLERGDFREAWGGIASVQVGLGAVWAEAFRRGIAFERVVSWMSEKPAQRFGLSQKGRIAVGCDADLVAWDPNIVSELKAEELLFRHKLSPFVGRQLRGRVEATWLRGQQVYRREGGVGATPRGIALKRREE